MIKLSYVCHALIIFFFQPRVAISLPPDELTNGPSGNIEGTTLDQLDPLSVLVPGDLTATLFHGATNSFDNSAVSSSDSQKSNLSPNENFDSPPAGANGGDNTALLLDESTGGGAVTDYLIPSVPIQILEGLPQVIDDLREWFNNPKKPECKNNKHALCCQKGGPSIIDGNPRPGGRRPSVSPKVLFDPIEYSQRRRVCRSCTSPIYISLPLPPPPFTISAFLSGLHISLGWGAQTGSADHPACQFPENVFCCYCQDYVCTHESIIPESPTGENVEMLKGYYYRIILRTFVITNHTPTSPNSRINPSPNPDKFPKPHRTPTQ